MSGEIETGGPAFPAEEDTEYPSSVVTTKHQGMTLRDYFATHVMQGMLAGMLADGSDLSTDEALITARMAYLHADAMLKARRP
jgi:hypothetical protein